MHAVVSQSMIWRVSLARIEQVVSGHLGPGRVPGNAAGPCFSRQVSMYLAKHVGRWSLSQIGEVLQRPSPHDGSARHRKN
jgi:hypothetical protein